MLISPAERDAGLLSLGTVSSVPERYGADFLLFSPVFGRVGVQRKTIADLVASVHDGRLEREISQLKVLDQSIFLLEGTPQWTNESILLSQSPTKYSKAMHLGIIFSLQAEGSWILQPSSSQESIEFLSSLERWMKKSRHGTLRRRSGPVSPWGTADSKDWQIHVMQGFPGVGYEKAKAIVESNGGLPLRLKEGVMLQNAKGVGAKLERSIMEALGE